MLLAHAGEDHTTIDTTQTHESTSEVMPSSDQQSSTTNYVALAGGVILLVIAAIIAYHLIPKRKPTAKTKSDS